MEPNPKLNMTRRNVFSPKLPGDGFAFLWLDSHAGSTWCSQQRSISREAKRRLCFRLFDSNQDGFAEKVDRQGGVERWGEALNGGSVVCYPPPRKNTP